jgi:hypothetical protein
MLSTISLDHQPCLKTDKIHNIRFNDDLTFEFVARHTMRSQAVPEQPFSIGGLSP